MKKVIDQTNVLKTAKCRLNYLEHLKICLRVDFCECMKERDCEYECVCVCECVCVSVCVCECVCVCACVSYKEREKEIEKYRRDR